MADLTELLSAQNMKVSLTDATGLEQAYLSANAGSTDAGTPRVVIANDQYQSLTAPFTIQQYGSKLAQNSQAFWSVTNSQLKGTTESPFYLFRNPNASGKTALIYRWKLTGAGIFKFYYIPTITATGTALTVVNKKLVSGAQGSVVTTFVNPTASANGTNVDFISVSSQVGSFVVELPDPMVVQPNFDVLVTTTMGANNTATNANPEWLEV